MMQRLLIICAFLSLVACASKSFNWNTNDYTVKSGDTLYSIAWSYEIAPSELARWNNLANSSMIYAGQRLHMRRPPDNIYDNSPSDKQTSSSSSVATSQSRNASKANTVIVKQDETLYGIARKHRLSVKQIASYNHLKKPYVIKPGQRLKLSASTVVVSANRKQGVKTTKPRQTANNKAVTWTWPIKGKVIKSFNRRLNDAKGIDIAGKEGKSIKAAATGKVVYSGNGLINYGNLIIIKHNDSYLSAYAHNRKLLVKEGQNVKRGQVIAELGQTGTENPRLHFEIRKNGKPVNPVRYLPSS